MPNNAANTKSFKEEVKNYLLQNSAQTIPYGLGCAYLGRGYDHRTVKDDVFTLETAYKLGFRYYDT
jgi:aryl-alcohol dehydrogenase-like predicted oxidoreductase